MLELLGMELLQVIEQKRRQVEITLLAGAVLLSEELPHLSGMLQQINKEIKMEGDHKERSNEKKTKKRDADIGQGELYGAWHQQHPISGRGHRDQHVHLKKQKREQQTPVYVRRITECLHVNAVLFRHDGHRIEGSLKNNLP